MENTPRKAISDTRRKSIRLEGIGDSDTDKDKSNKSPGQSGKSTIKKKPSVSAKKSSARLPSARKLSKARNLNNVLKTIPFKKMADNNSSKNASTKSFTNFSNLNAKKPAKASINSNGLVNSQIINKATKTKTSKAENAPDATKRLVSKNGEIPRNGNPKGGPPMRLATKKIVSEVSLALKKVNPPNPSATKRAASRAAASSKSLDNKKMSGANSTASKRTTSTASLENHKGDNLPTRKTLHSIRLTTRGKISSTAVRSPSVRSRTTPNTLATKKMACKLIDYKESGSSKTLAITRKAPTTTMPPKRPITARNSAIARNLPSSSRNLPLSSRNLPSASRNLPSASRNLPSSSRNLPSSSRNLPPSSRKLPTSSVLTSKKVESALSTTGKVPTAATRFPNIKRMATNLTKDPALTKKSIATKNGNSDVFKKLSQAKRLDMTKVEGSNMNLVPRLKRASVVLDKIPIPSGNDESKTGLRKSGSGTKALSVSFDKKSLSSNLGHSTTLFKSPTRPMMTMKSAFLPQLDNQSSTLQNLVVPVLSTMEEINSIKESVELEKDSEINDETIKVMLENAEKIWDKNVSNFSKKLRNSKKSNSDESIVNLSKIEECEIDDSDLVNNQSLQNKLQEQNCEVDNMGEQLAKCLQKNQQLNDDVKVLKCQNKNWELAYKKLVTIEAKKQTNLLKNMKTVENENLELSNHNKSLEALVSKLRKELLEKNKSFEFEQSVNSEYEDESIKNVLHDIIDAAVESSRPEIETTVKDLLWDIVQNISDTSDPLDNGLQKDGTVDTVKMMDKPTLKRKCNYEISESPLAKRKKFETEELLTDDTDKWTKDVVHDLVCNIENMEGKEQPDLDASKKCIGDVFLDIMNKIEVCDTVVKTKTFSVDEILMDILDAITEEKSLKGICENKPVGDNECQTPMKMLKLDIGRTFLDLMNKMDEKPSQVKSKSFSMDELLMNIVDTAMDGKDPKTSKRKLVDEIERQSDPKKYKFDLQLPLPWE